MSLIATRIQAMFSSITEQITHIKSMPWNDNDMSTLESLSDEVCHLQSQIKELMKWSRIATRKALTTVGGVVALGRLREE